MSRVKPFSNPALESSTNVVLELSEKPVVMNFHRADRFKV
jgi:hypothetical protein